MRTCFAILMLTLLPTIAMADNAPDGYVWVDGQQIRGPISVGEGVIRVGNRAFDADQVMMLVPSARSVMSMQSQAVRLRDGQRWPGQVEGINGQTLTIDGPLIGRREVALNLVAGIDLGPAAPPTSGTLPQVVRTQGEPVPGRLLWLDTEQVGIDSPLGVLRLNRAVIARIELATTQMATGTFDELRLLDGTVLFGRITLKQNELILQHDTLGELTFPPNGVAVLLRHDADRVWLNRATQYTIDAKDVFGQARTVPHAVDDRGRVSVESPGSITISLPPIGEQGGRFVAMVHPLAKSQGDAQVTIELAGQQVWAEAIAPGQAAKAVNIPVPAGRHELTMIVMPGQRIAFPCGIQLVDAHLRGVQR